MTDWRKALLQQLGYKPTRASMKFLSDWQRWEGGHTNNDATYNWLNTTKNAPGVVRSINSVGVKAFDSFENGIRATAQTLLNGRYDDIVRGLASGDPYKVAPMAGLQVWVSGREDGNPAYARKVLGLAGNAPAATPAGGGASPPRAMRAAAEPDGWNADLLKIAFPDDPAFVSMLRSLRPKELQRKGVVAPKGSLAAPSAVPTDRLLAAADSQIGKPYVFGSGPSTASFDCSDLVQWAYRQVGVDIPRTTYQQMKVLPKIGWKGMRPGDLIYKNDGGHVVMYVGDGKVIAAPYTGTVVQYQPVARFRGGNYHVRRVPR